ncbi:MAG: hypothetical protein ACRDZ6_04425 [Acidimicrobiales bacterium]
MTGRRSSAVPGPGRSVLDRLSDQPRAERLLRASVSAPVHAYLFLGPPGTGRREAAVAFAAALVCPEGGCGTCPACTEALAGRHPDVVIVEREGASISVGRAREVTRLSLRAPRSARRQVLILVDFHLVTGAAPALLKTIEEPPDTTVLVLIADGVPAEFVTIASRCVRVDFEPLSEEAIAAVLVREGADKAHSDAVAGVARGRLDRARLLLADAGFADRLKAWREVPTRLDGTGATVAQIAASLLEGASEPVEVLKARQADELASLAAEADAFGERQIPGHLAIEERHHREQRRVRTDELRAGLAMLAAAYHARLVAAAGSAPAHATGPAGRPAISVPLRAVELVGKAAEGLVRNPNELLLLESLLLRLDALA